jgi:tetratricopeptide (TPR) repeat protein
LPHAPRHADEPGWAAGQAALLRAGRFEEAVARAEARVREAPGVAAGWSALANSLVAARRPERALAAWDRALALAPDAPDLLCGKGRTLQILSRLEPAVTLYRRALSLDPERFEAAFNLALLALEAGDWTAAERWAAPLQARHPQSPDLAWLAARVALGRGAFDAARDSLVRLARDPRLGPEQRADALLLLGEALEGLGQAREAFASAVEGKAIQRRLYAERAAGREGAVERFARLTAWFASAEPGDWSEGPTAGPVPGEAAEHVFLVGFPRSGTTLLEQALAGHPQVVALEEAPTLAAAHAQFMGSAQGLERLARLDGEAAQHWRVRYWAEVEAQGAKVAGRTFLDKAPAGTIDLPLVAKLFPRAKVLFALRDPRDVALSCLRNSFQLNAMTYAFTDLQQTAACYAGGMALAEVYRALLPLTVLEVRHESLVEDFEAGLAAICGFLGLQLDPAMADVAATARARPVRTPSAAQVRAGVNRKGVGRWRAYAAELAPVLPVLEPWVRRFGYDET